jgi:type I restriction enzyme S subunit
MGSWKEDIIANVIEKIATGKTPPTTNKEYFDGDIDWYTPQDLVNRIELHDSKRKISKKALQDKKAVVFDPGTLLITCIGNIGRLGITTKYSSSNQQITGLRFRPIIDTRFAFYYFLFIQSELEHKANSAVVPILNNAGLKEIKISYPDIKTQKQIACILEDADRARQQRKAANALTEQFLQSSFLYLFGDPVQNEKGWEVKKLEDLGKWQSGGTPSRKVEEFFGGIIPWYTSGELNQMFVSKSSEYITEQAIKNSNAKIVEPNSLLLGMYDTAALKSSITTINSACNQAIAYSKLENGNANIFYVYHAIQYGKEHFKSQQRGVRQKNLNLTMVKELLLPLPPLPLQQHFASLVADAEILRQKQQQSEQELEQLFQALLQRYFAKNTPVVSLLNEQQIAMVAEPEESYSVPS